MLVADRYRLAELLGRGGMGEVWQAQDEVLGRQVAVKLLLGDDGDESAASRFRLEAQTAARLNHPQVVAVYDFGSWDGRFYLVMELVRGPSLAQELSARGPLAPRRVARIAAQSAAGLAAAHRQGVVHRDIKPGNLMLDADDTLKIGDFGIARFVDETSAALTRVGQIVGTSTYLAPERALGKVAGPASDVYALGCVLYQLLAGQPPFWADSPTALLYLHVDTPPVPPRQHRADLPPAFEAFLLRMLAKKPEDRPTAQEAADWFAGPSWEEPLRPVRTPLPEPVHAPAPAVPAGVPGRPPVPPSVRPAAAVPGALGAPGIPGAPGVPGAPVVPPGIPAPAPAQAPGAAPSQGHRRSSGGSRSSRGSQGAGGLKGPGSGGGGKGIRSPKVLLSAVAGAVAFLVAAVIGASVFGGSGSETGSQRPEAPPTESADRAPGGNPASPKAVPADAAPSSSPGAHKKPKSKKKSKEKDEDDD
ncbi:serine/threonine protein kinase [Streptomyces klenkii]|uniref:non-specific serine/threonine protein kinase n=2 Tax=Streptomyces klenkii TaxID=1420899 RepID=A0A3B0BEN6_9ACTN|nr:serine/threonine-protein kinase [Streptomyces klenkii]RKN70527.1 serine/threonine protein kinase [Streptomyces klenkii]